MDENRTGRVARGTTGTRSKPPVPVGPRRDGPAAPAPVGGPGQDDGGERTRHLEEVRELAHLLDNSLRIPIINYRFGVDAILGLVPVVGDFSSFALSGWIIYRAARMGVPRSLLLRMTANALGDTVVGSVPVLGTLVDVVWKANARNLRLLERFLDEGR